MAKSDLYVAYYRVSTKQQGVSGLGLEAQRQAVAGYVQGKIIAEYTEIESGKQNQRVKLKLAIDLAKKEDAVLVIAKLDRLSRNASFIFTLRDTGVKFQCVDMPDANILTIGIFATLAQHERELISKRTKDALAVKRNLGAKLGTPGNLTPAARSKGTAATRVRASSNENNRRATRMINLLWEQKKSLTQIAADLNEAGFTTANGKSFRLTQVSRLLERSALLATATATD